MQAADEREAAAQRRRVEAARAGVVYAYNWEAYQRWRTSQAQAMAATGGGGLAGAELEAVLLAMARTNPDIVRVVYR